MLDVGLCIAVKDEESQIADCLSPILGMFAQVIVIDTGSTDRTRELLQDLFGIEPWRVELDESECLSLSKVRNLGFAELTTPWLMTLDADERIDPRELQAVLDLQDADLPAGLFSRWDTDFGDGVIIEDYKLGLFRQGHRHEGLIHDTAQPSLRARGDVACWLPQMRVLHLPDGQRSDAKENIYSWRLDCAMRREPHWLRYQWFAGHTAWRQGRPDDSEPLLKLVHEARPRLFPVESLNASMVLAAIAARKDDRPATQRILGEAIDYFAAVAGDFEVEVNFRMGPWLDKAKEAADRGDLDAVLPYRFPY